MIRGCLGLRVGLWWTETLLASMFEIVVRPFLFPKKMLVWRLRGHLPVSTSLMD